MTALFLSLALLGQCSPGSCQRPADGAVVVVSPARFRVVRSYSAPVVVIRRTFRPVRGVIRLLGGVCR